MESPFLDKEKIVENKFAYAFYDGFPVSKGHVLVVPKRVVPEIFDLNDDEYEGCFKLVKDVKEFTWYPNENLDENTIVGIDAPNMYWVPIVDGAYINPKENT